MANRERSKFSEKKGLPAKTNEKDSLLLSVVIATFNRKSVLETTLKLLTEQTFPNDRFEVVLVDDGSTDETQKMVAAMQPGIPYELHFFQQPENLGPGAANNRGVREAKSDIILFLADDMHATPSVLEEHYRSHLNNPQSNVAVVGKLRESKRVPQTAFHKGWNPYKGRELDNKKELGEFDFWISNLSIKRDFFQKYGIFIERKGPAMEDLELSYRLFKNGMKLIYCKEALTYHYHPQTIDDAIKRGFLTGEKIYFYEKMVDHDKLYKHCNLLSRRLNSASFIKIFFREMLRKLFFNMITVPYIVMPLIRSGETNKLIEPFVGFLSSRALSYYFRKGVRKCRANSQ